MSQTSRPAESADASGAPEPVRSADAAPLDAPAPARRPHVLLLCDGRGWQRMAPIVRRLAVGLIDQAIRVWLICEHDCPSDAMLPGLSGVYHLNKPGCLDLLRPARRFEELAEALRRSQATCIHALCLSSLKTALLARQALGLPLLLGVDAFDKPRLKLLAAQLGPDVLAAPMSDRLAAALQAHATDQAIRQFTEVVRPGIHVQTRSRPPFEPGAPVSVLVVQAAGRGAGLETVLRAAARLLEERLDLMLFFIDAGSAETHLRKLAVRLRIHEHVTFTGRFSRWPLTLAATDVVVLPQPHRQVFIHPMEATASATLTVAAAGHGYDAIVNGVTGLEFDPRDAQALAAKLAEVLKDPHRARSIAYAGQERIRQYHSVSRMVTAYVALYERLAKTRPAGPPRAGEPAG